jgi:hypothetical protein
MLSAEENLQLYLGAVFTNPQRRDAHDYAVDNFSFACQRPWPSSKREWKTLFHNAAQLLTEYIWVTTSQKVSENFMASYNKAFQAGFVDFEDIYLKTVGDQSTPSDKTTMESSDTSVLKAALAQQQRGIEAALQQSLNQNQQLAQQIQTFVSRSGGQVPDLAPRGRGRGFRGGRGRGRGQF